MYKNVQFLTIMRKTTNDGVYPATGGQQGPARFFFLLSQPSVVDGDCRVNTERPEATLGGNSVFVTGLGPTNSRYCENAN